MPTERSWSTDGLLDDCDVDVGRVGVTRGGLLVVLGVAAARTTAGSRNDAAYGPLNEHVICPHCHKGGHVRIKARSTKTGISGAKATGAVLTGGASVLVTGLSKKDLLNHATCANCSVTWVI